MDCHFFLFLKSWYEKGENLHQGLDFRWCNMLSES